MKTLTSIKKTLKLLMRSKASALVVLLAPLLIVLIIGVGFLDTGESQLTLGVVGEDSELSERFIESLEEEYELIAYENTETCRGAIQEGVIISCVSFPAEFGEENASNQIDFYVDESRMNLVYRIISSLSEQIGEEGMELSEEITAEILGVLEDARSEIDSSVTSIVGIQGRTSSIIDDVSSARSNVGDIDGETDDVSIDDYSGDVSDLKSEVQDFAEDSESLLDESKSVRDNENINDSEFDSAISSLESAIDDLENQTYSNFDDLEDNLEDVFASFANLENQLSDMGEAASSAAGDLEEVENSLEDLSEEAGELRTKQESILSSIESLEHTDAERVAQPVTTNIEPITADLGELTYSFPYLLMLVIMLVGIMLSSTLVFIEKDSKAYFRNFTTPTKSFFFASITYITSSMIILVQAIAILLLAFFGLNIPLIDNIEVTAIVIILGMTVFILLGMLIGELFNTSEAITMANIALGAIFIFLSNLILPLETLSEEIRVIAEYNPYVVASESIRSSLLFGASIQSIGEELIILTGYAIILLIVIMTVRKMTTSRYFYDLKHKNKKINTEDDHSLIMDNKKVISSEKDLLEELKNITDEEYAKHTKPKNIFSMWLEKDLGSKYLAYRIKNKTRKKAIAILEKRIKKKDKRNKKKD